MVRVRPGRSRTVLSSSLSAPAHETKQAGEHGQAALHADQSPGERRGQRYVDIRRRNLGRLRVGRVVSRAVSWRSAA